MKDGLRGQHFPDNRAVIAAVRKRFASAGADFYEHSVQALVHHGENSWPVVLICGIIAFVAENVLYPTALACTRPLL
jgi:hypothetical protein